MVRRSKPWPRSRPVGVGWGTVMTESGLRAPYGDEPNRLEGCTPWGGRDRVPGPTPDSGTRVRTGRTPYAARGCRRRPGRSASPYLLGSGGLLMARRVTVRSWTVSRGLRTALRTSLRGGGVLDAFTS